MKPGKLLREALLLLALPLIAGGCAQTPMAQKAAATVKAQPLAENPVELVNQLDREVANARMNQLHILSPTWFEKAQTAFLEAKANLDGGKQIAAIRENVVQARTGLHQAEEMAKISRTTLPEAIKGREMARNAGAARFESEYARIENDFLDLTQAIEKNNLRYAQNNQDKVVNDFRDLEIRAIKESTIGEVRALISRAEGLGAKKIAPRTLQEAVDQLQATDDFITRNPYAKEEMHAMAAKALFLANRAVVITEQSGRLKNMDSEAVALWSEDNLFTISNALGAPDMRDQAFEIQLDNIVGSIKSLNDDRGFIADQKRQLQSDLEKMDTAYQRNIEALNNQIAALEGKTRQEQLARGEEEKERLAAEQKLETERRFNQKYMEVQNYFAKDEAEVYKQENRLVLRLKAVRFPVGKSILMPENYSLLSKVQKAIRTFDEPLVVIEGHTDSTGTDDINQLLSQQRADAVKEYMIANQTLPAENMTAVGYGPERPLAPNTTQEGRAINRRIDIVITPVTDPAR